MSNPTLKHVENIKIYGFSTRTQNRDEFNEKTAKIPTIWQNFYASSLANQTEEAYGVYSNYESDANGLYTVTAGVPNAENKIGLSAITIQKGLYLVFENEGLIPESVIKTWRQIWEYFTKKASYQRNFLTDFELYTDKDKVAVYIGIHD